MYPIKLGTEPVVARPLEPLIAEDDRVVFRYVVAETEDYEKKIKVEDFTIFRFQEGRIAELWSIDYFIPDLTPSVTGVSENE